MEGRGYLDSYRNTSEELFIKTMTDNSIGMPAPTMEMLGFKNLSQNFRTDSEELFKSWLTNGENSGYNSLSTTHRTRQASRRISTELATLSCQQHGSLLQQKDENDSLLPQNTYAADEAPMRNVAEQGLQASNLYLARAWFHSSQPMTRSRSSELRRRYVAMQNSQTALGIDVLHEMPGLDAKQDSANPNGLNDTSMFEIPNHFSTFVSPSNSSSSTFTNPQMHTVDKVSSVVSMLKGTLERKKLNNHIEKEAIDENGLGYYGAQEVYGDTCVNQGQGDRIDDAQGTFQDVSAAVQGEDAWVQPMVEEGSLDMEFEGFISLANPIQMNTVSREPSQSESSAAAPVVSTGFDACDGPNNSGPTTSISKSSRKQLKSERSIDNGLSSKNIREQIYVNLKDDRKPKGSLVRYGSLKSAVSVDKGDPTKKRRVERSRKMAEAKERNLSPAIPSDMQSVLKRCENLEKEVRSLKLNLAFMNRKDSEQSKQIEDLQKQNEELAEEKERLLEEIERIISETGKM